jgi:beta-glucosidase
MYGCNQYDLSIDGKQLFKFNSEHGAEHKYATVEFVAGKMYKLDVKFVSYGSSPIIKLNWEIPDTDYKTKALEIAKQADVVVMCMGLSPRIEGEEMKIKIDGFDGGDRTKLKLPDVQEDLIKEIKALRKPVVLVMVNGSAVAINWEQENIPAILESWYGGQQAGNAIADILFGDYNPGGKLPVTFYKSENDIPAFDDYNMKGRTYRYFEGKPLFQFGYGLSYTSFNFSNLSTNNSTTNNATTVKVDVENTGNYDGEEVVQLYIKHIGASLPVPIQSLKGFQRIFLKKGEKKTVIFTLKPQDFSVINNDGKEVFASGQTEVFVGGGQPGSKGLKKEIKLAQ